MTRIHSTSKHDRRSILRLLFLFILAVCCHPATARPPADNALVSSSGGIGSSKMGALVAEEHSTYGNAADWSGGSSSSKSSSRRGTLSAAELSTHGGAAEHSSGGRWSAAQGLLRLRAGPGRRKRSQWAALDSLLDRYAERHKRCLFDQKYKGQYVIVSMGDSFSGLGNRMLSVVTGMLMALMTQRCFFLRHDTYLRDFRNSMGLDMRWWEHEAGLQRWGRHNLTTLILGPRSIWAMSPTDPLYITGDLQQLWGGHDAVDIHYDNDYLVPLLLSNPNYRTFFDRYFPSREIFHPLGRFLFDLHPRHEAAAHAFRASKFGAFTVGIQIRTQKPLGAGLADPSIGQFCSLARAVQLKHGLPDDRVNFFVATDSEGALEGVRKLLGAERVVNTDGGGVRGGKGTQAGNPGSEESAVLDMRLLSMTDALIVTSASSFGYVAAAWGGIVPIHVLHRGDKPSMLNPYFYTPLNSEPCYWGAHRYFLTKAPKEAVELLRDNPMWMQYAHCQ